MSAGVIIGEALIVVLQALMLWAKEKGLSDEECDRLIDEAVLRIKASKPEQLPDV